MKTYIQTDASGEFYNVNAFLAQVGFQSLGYEILKYVSADEIADPDPEAILVGGVGNVRKRLTMLGIPIPAKEIEYPDELRAYLGRKIWRSTLKEVFADENQRNIFVKPTQTKAFPGKVFHNFKDFIGLDPQSDMEVWCSEPIALVTEWRCFIRYGEILDVRYYKGAWDSRLDIAFVRQAVKEYDAAPAAYTLDFGVDGAGKHYLVEANDGHSIGSYGMGAISYAKFLSARWAELTRTTDYLHF